jgi:hypothetical protein
MSRLLSAANPSKEGTHERCAIYCGREGWLSLEEFEARTAAGIDAYAKDQPLKFRQAHLARKEDGSRVHRWDYATPIPKLA